MTRSSIGLGLALLALAACDRSAPAPNKAAPVKVAAASDLAFAFKDVGAEFEKRTGTPVTFSFGSTGMLAKQIAEGAPFDLFAAANVSFTDEVVKAGACDDATKAPYARGRIVVWTRDGGVTPPDELADLAHERFVKIGIANPEHAPYGRAAQQALQSSGIWDKVKARMVFGENIQQTFQFAQTGNVDAAIVALSLATVTKGGRELVVDEAAHKPIDQALVACTRGRSFEAGKRFGEFVNSPDGRAIMRKYGFLLPGETTAQAR
jgi:molybdate transport system substrate-binding protein